MKKFLRIPKILNIMREGDAYYYQHVLRTSPRYTDKKHLIPFGHKVYSQGDEDGIIAEIFKRIGSTNKVFVEFGVGKGLQNNTLALLFQGWTGLWIEGSQQYAGQIRKNFVKAISSGKLSIVCDFITRDNINSLISSVVSEATVDLLSVDIDGNDFHILDAIDCIQPRVIVIEYNAKFAPPIEYCMSYDQSHEWLGDDNYGASLKFLEVGLQQKGYCLVGCNLIGNNAFFVRQDAAGDKFLTPHSAETHYEPAKYFLASITSGHPASYKTLENAWASD